MIRARVAAAMIAVLLLSSGPPARASEILIEWTGVFEIPDLIDPPGVFLDLEVGPDPGGMNVIADLDIGLVIPATWQGDLIISLEHVESGSFHRLLDRPGTGVYGFSADNYGNPVTGERFVLDDEAPNPYDYPWVEPPGIPNVTGHWQPDTDPLSSFDGESIVGTWRFWFADLGGGDLAQVENILMTFTTIPTPATGAVLVPWMMAGRRRRPRPRAA